MSNIKPWRERLDAGASSSDVMDDMQTEITRLSTALAERDAEIERLIVLATATHIVMAERELIRTAAQQALEALINERVLNELNDVTVDSTDAAITALTAALESKT